jgi:UPF0755 protein
MRLTLSLCLLGLSLMLAACSSDQLLAAYLETNRAKLDQPASTMHEELTFVVEPGTPARTIAENLAARGLINDARLFEAYVRTTGITQQLEAGTFTLSPDMTPMEIAQALQNAYRENTTVTIPEGWRLEQVADALSDGRIVDGEEYLRLATQSGWLPNSAEGVGAPWAFLAFRPADASLEGYLFPDTYQLDVDNATAEELLRRQLEAFAQGIDSGQHRRARGGRGRRAAVDRKGISQSARHRHASGSGSDRPIRDGLSTRKQAVVEVAGISRRI